MVTRHSEVAGWVMPAMAVNAPVGLPLPTETHLFFFLTKEEINGPCEAFFSLDSGSKPA